MRDALRSIGSDRVALRVLRATLASLGFGRKNAIHDDLEEWIAAAGEISVTIHAENDGAPPSRKAHSIGNLHVYELPPGATVDGRYLRLTPAELAILARLARAQTQFVTLVELARAVKIGAPMSLRALTVHVFALRRKLEKSHSRAHVTTKRGLGYKLDVM